jgi:hypothetical protein
LKISKKKAACWAAFLLTVGHISLRVGHGRIRESANQGESREGLAADETRIFQTLTTKNAKEHKGGAEPLSAFPVSDLKLPNYQITQFPILFWFAKIRGCG